MTKIFTDGSRWWVRDEPILDANVPFTKQSEAEWYGKAVDRVGKLETALRIAEDYIEKVGDYGEGGTSDHAIALDAVRTALQKSTE